MANTAIDPRHSIADMDAEQLPIPMHKLHGWPHFAGLYAAEHVAATEFVIGATFVALGAGIWDILIGLLIGNTLAVLSFTLITSPIAVDTRSSLYTYLNRIAGDSMSRLYNAANVLIFGVISAAMITVSATAVRALFDIPPQVHPYPTSVLFFIVAVAVAVIVVLVAVFGFNAVAEFASICAPWLMVMFTVGGMLLLPALSEFITGYITLTSFSDFVQIAGATVWTGLNAEGEPGIGMLEVAGFAWAANTFSHFGLVDMALLRYAKKKSYGLATSAGMMFGHYVAWISAGLMGAATAALTKTSIMVVDPGDDPGDDPGNVRHRRCLAGRDRAVLPMCHRGCVLRWPVIVGTRRRPDDVGCASLRDDEDPTPQRKPFGDGISGFSCQFRVYPRGHGRPAIPSILCSTSWTKK